MDKNSFAQFYQQSMRNIVFAYHPRNVCKKNKLFKLYRYHTSAAKNSPAVLVVFAAINKPEILELLPQDSFLGDLLDAELNVYLVEWQEANTKLSLSFSNYIDAINSSAEYIAHRHGNAKINLLGICQGGLMSCCYAAMSNHIKNLILMATPIDFHQDDFIVANLIRRFDLQLTDDLNAIPGKWLTDFFISLRPFDLLGKKYLQLLERYEDKVWLEKFFRIEKWLHDTPNQHTGVFRELLEQFFQRNNLIKGRIKINDEVVRLRNIKMPVLNIVAEHDHLIANSASLALPKYISSKDYTERSFPTGHIGLFVSRIRPRITQTIIRWLQSRA